LSPRAAVVEGDVDAADPASLAGQCPSADAQRAGRDLLVVARNEDIAVER